jgi:hypothetical protein
MWLSWAHDSYWDHFHDFTGEITAEHDDDADDTTAATDDDAAAAADAADAADGILAESATVSAYWQQPTLPAITAALADSDSVILSKSLRCIIWLWTTMLDQMWYHVVRCVHADSLSLIVPLSLSAPWESKTPSPTRPLSTSFLIVLALNSRKIGRNLKMKKKSIHNVGLHVWGVNSMDLHQ